MRQVKRKAVGVVKREGGLAVEHVALFERCAFLVQYCQAAIQRLAETGFLELQRFFDEIFRAHQFRISLSHLAHQRPDKPIHQRLFGAEQLPVPHRATHNSPQHIAAALVRRQHAIGNQKRRCSQMVGDHAQRCLLRTLRIGTGKFGDLPNERDEQVDVIVVVLTLQHGGNALQPHAGVDRWLGQRRALSRRALVELHENEIPNLDETVAIFIGRARRATGNLVAVIEKDFRTWSAWAGIAHLPKVIRGGDADNFRIRQARDFLPEFCRFFVLRIHRDKKAILRQRVILGD